MSTTSKMREALRTPPIQPEGREPTVAEIAGHILDRMHSDGTKDAAQLMMVYREDGAFRRVLFDDLGMPPRSEKWFYDPSYSLTGARLRALCEAAMKSPDKKQD